MNPLRKAAFIETEGQRVGCRRSEIGQAIVKLENEGGRRKSPERNGGVTAFHSPEGGSADEQARRHVHRGNPSFATCERKITAQFTERMCGGQRNRREFRHEQFVSYVKHSGKYCLVYTTLLRGLPL